MVWCFWSSKGGSGCSVMAAATAMLSARRQPVLLVDLAGGDQARILGVEPKGAGLVRWLGHTNPPPDSLARLEQAVADGLFLLPFCGPDPDRTDSVDSHDGGVDLDDRLSLLARLLAADERLVVVDLGLPGRPAVGTSGSTCSPAFPALLDVAERSTLVTRLCYLALVRTMEQPVPDDVLVVVEPDRALRVADVEAAMRVPVATVRWDPAVARAVDAGLLVRRLPRALHRLPVPTPTSDAGTVEPAAARSTRSGGRRT